MSKKRTSAGIRALVVMVLATLALPVPVFALQQAGLQISPKHPRDTRSFPPIAGNQPADSNLTSPRYCKVANYCDAIPLVLDVPKGGIFVFHFDVMWKDDADLDAYLYEEVPVKGGEDPVYTETTKDPRYERVASSAGGNPPPGEFGKAADLPPSSTKRKYWLDINNWVGGNAGYTVTITYAPQTLPDFSQYEPKEFFQRRREQFAPDIIDPAGRADFSKAKPPELEPVKVPGKDGPLEDLGLAKFKGEQYTPTERSRLPLVLATLLTLALGSGLFVFFLARQRKREESA